jgi:hypothetical protein
MSESPAVALVGTNSRLFPETLDILNIPIEFQSGFSACINDINTKYINTIKA